MKNAEQTFSQRKVLRQQQQQQPPCRTYIYTLAALMNQFYYDGEDYYSTRRARGVAAQTTKENANFAHEPKVVVQ